MVFFLTVLRVSIIERISQNCNFFSYSKATEKRWKCINSQLCIHKINNNILFHSSQSKKVLFFSCKMWTDIWMFTRKYSAIKKVVAKSSFIHSHVETVTKKKSHLHLNFWIFCSIFCWISLFVKMKEWDWKYHSLSNQTIQLGHFSFSELFICVNTSLWLLCKYIHWIWKRESYFLLMVLLYI